MMRLEVESQAADIAAKPFTPTLRFDWQREEIRALFNLPLPRLMRTAAEVHAAHFADDEIQLCTLLSVKTGGCKEDCSYCPQSAHHKTNLEIGRAHV